MKKTQFKNLKVLKSIKILTFFSVSTLLSISTFAQLTVPAGTGNGQTLIWRQSTSSWEQNNFVRVPDYPNSQAIFEIGDGGGPTLVRTLHFEGNVGIALEGAFGDETATWLSNGWRSVSNGLSAGNNFVGSRVNWEQFASNIGLTDRSSGNQRDLTIQFQDITVPSNIPPTNRLIFSGVSGFAGATTTREYATILGNGNMGIGLTNPMIKLQVQEGNIGQASEGNLGTIGTGNRWTVMGQRLPPISTPNPFIRQEGIRTQWDNYGTGLGLTDRSSSPIKDAVLIFQDANANYTAGTPILSQNKFIIGARDGVGSGATASNVRQYLVIQGNNGNTSIGINPPAPTAKLEIFGNGASQATTALKVMDEDGNSLLTTRDDGFTGVIVTSPISPIGNFSLGGSPTPSVPGAGSIFFSVEENMTASGSLYVGNDVYATSDARLKKDFEELSKNNSWKSVLNITPYSYKFDQDKVDNIKFDERTRYGFKAQEVAENIPELTKMWGEALVVNYQGFVPFLAAGIQEHEKEIDDIVKENEQIKQENEELKTQVQSLEDKLNELYNLPAIQNALKESKQSGTLDAQPKLYQNEPNPFGSKTIIRYVVPNAATSALIKVVDNSGVEMGQYKIQKGSGQLEITAGTIPAGNYNYSLYIDNQLIDTKKMIIVNY